MQTVVTKSEIAVLVETWLLKEGFNGTALTFKNEAKQYLDKISSKTRANAKSLQEILEDYLRLKIYEKKGGLANLKEFIVGHEEQAEVNRKRTAILSKLHMLVEDYSQWRADSQRKHIKRPRGTGKVNEKGARMAGEHLTKNKRVVRFDKVINQVTLDRNQVRKKEEPQINSSDLIMGTLEKLLADKSFASKLAAKINETRLVEPEFETEPHLIASVAERLMEEEIKSFLV